MSSRHRLLLTQTGAECGVYGTRGLPKYDLWAEEDGTNVAGMQDLIKAAGTMLVGKDGRLLELRQNRRSRLAWLSGQLVRRDGRLSVLEQRRFPMLDEEHVAEKLLAIQREAAARGSPLQW